MKILVAAVKNYNPPAANFARTLENIIGIYRKRYIAKNGRSLFESEEKSWRTVEKYLTDERIEAGVFERAILGIFLASCPTSFCVDIDDHTGRGEGFLLSLYQKVCTQVGSFPSIVCKTPRGLHAYYFLTYPVHVNILVPKVQKLVENLPVEVKPTHRIGARIPRVNSLLDPVNLMPIDGDFTDIILSAPRSHPAEIFDENTTPEAVRRTLKNRRLTVLSMREGRTLAKFESRMILAGETNKILCDLIPQYRTAGLTPEEAALRFTALLSADYEGELRNFQRLRTRVKSFYRAPPPSRFDTAPKSNQPDFFTGMIAGKIAEMVTGPTENGNQKRAIRDKQKTVKKAVAFIENWRSYIDDVKRDKVEVEFWNYLYPFFKKNTTEGYYPIPVTQFKKIHAKYETWLLPFLRDVGYLERSPYGYSNAADKTTCYHWKIHGEKFI